MRGYERFAILALFHYAFQRVGKRRIQARRLTHGLTCSSSWPTTWATVTWEFTATPRSRRRTLIVSPAKSVRLKNFYVSPVCSPTRASLLTGRYNFRTGVVDTYLGRALMRSDEVTLAEMLGATGYRTGIFGKWHLGDNAPLRTIDQGFEASLVLKGGGIGQPSDPPGGSSYSDPILQANGQPQRFKGYCSDIFAKAAIDFIDHRAGDRPFFAYLAFNCPHEPLEAPEAELAMYKSMNLELSTFPQLGKPIPATFAAPADKVARVYAMITNIDTNVGKVLDGAGHPRADRQHHRRFPHR